MAQSEKNKQGEAAPPRRNRTEPGARESANIAATAFAKKGFRDPTLVLRWGEIVGPEIARIARPVRLTEDEKGGTLTLKAEPGASVFLQHETRNLCEQINTYLGRPAVSRLRFIQGPIATRPMSGTSRPHPGAAAAEDPAQAYKGREELRAGLLALAGWRRRLPAPD